MTELAKFNINYETELLAAGSHFWCVACLSTKPLDDRSPDLRYCLGCYGILCMEAEMIEGHVKRASWMPKIPAVHKKSPAAVLSTPQGARTTTEVVTTPTPKEFPTGDTVTGLVTEKIKVLAGQGMPCRVIEKELAKEGIFISYRTIARRLQGVLI